MKTIMTSNWRPLGRALCTLLLGIAALWAMPRSAHAQLYVSQLSNGSVGEYDATTGVAINANFITGLDNPGALALLGNKLFAANQTSGRVGEYNATTGAAINVNFILGLYEPFGLALSGNNLFVWNGLNNTVGKYDATTSAEIKANFITGLNHPSALVLSGNKLFLSNIFAPPGPEPSIWQ